MNDLAHVLNAVWRRLEPLLGDARFALLLETWLLPATLASALLVLLLMVGAFRTDSNRLRFWLPVAALWVVAAVGLAWWTNALTWRQVGEGRMTVLLEMERRPFDFWPRGTGHVPFGPFGSDAFHKPYMEPGGSISPGYDTFGVSIWVLDEAGRIVATSDTIPLEQTRMAYVSRRDGVQGVSADTPHYQATWWAESEDVLTLDLLPKNVPGTNLELAIRSVGPSGGSLRRLSLSGTALRIGSSWSVSPVNGSDVTYLGVEGVEGWTGTRRLSVTEVDSPAGWAHARLRVRPQGMTSLRLARLSPSAPPLVPPVWPTDPVARTSGLDHDFDASLNAQRVTLLHGIVGRDTRPGDPVNYPLPWLRDGAYVVVALARSGHVATAKTLAVNLATVDFFGGFGAEADAPGLALWAIGEVARLARSPDFDAAMWPHVQRKTELILNMLAADRDIRSSFKGPAVPALSHRPNLDLVAGPARDGLINGRMDWHRPVFYVNGVSFAGLREAAAMAERLGHAADAKAWSNTAAQMGAAWNAAFTRADRHEDLANERTAIVGLWPAAVAERTAYARMLEERWQRHYATMPTTERAWPWTYFTVAEAHQWLLLGRSDRAWEILRTLWKLQPAPGVYTLWEGEGEENTFGLWKLTRGWVHPPNVTPHYWSAAEMLLLQLAMLAAVDRLPDGPRLLVGAGVPAEALARSLSVQGVGTSRGFVDWTWDGTRVTVEADGPPIPIELGRGFPAGTKVDVRWRP